MKNFRIQYLLICLCSGLVCLGQPGTDGFVQYRYPGGAVSSEGRVVNGKPEGYWKSYYEDGTLKSEGNRVASLLDSTWRFYGQDGMLTTTIEYKGDRKNGVLRKYGQAGILLSEETFVDDQKNGMSLTFHPSGAVHWAVPFKDGREEGKAVEYAEDGRIITIAEHRAGLLRTKENINRMDEQGWKQGLWREYWPDPRLTPGQLPKPKLEGRYVDDKRQGIFKEFDPSGALRTMEKYDQDQVQKDAEEVKLLAIRNTYHPNGKVASVGSYSRNGQREGLFRSFDDSGSPISAAIYQGDRRMSEGQVSTSGALTGRWTEFYVTGEKRAEGEYKDGRKEGPWVFYHRGGEVEQRGNYVNGLPQGEWVWFFPGGARHREENYRKGREDGPSVEYDSTGAVITQGEYIDGLKDGRWIYQLGDHREEGAYKDGLRDGEWVFTYPDGRRAFVGSFVNGEPKGRHRWWWPNGRLEHEGRYSGGLEQGDHIFYDELGNVRMIINYRNGAEIKLLEEKLPPPYEPGGDGGDTP